MKQRTIFFAILVFIISCTKDKDFEDQEYPVLRTLAVTNISPDGATLNGQFLNRGKEEILRYGFVFDTDSADIRYSDTAIATNINKDGSFSLTIDDAFTEGVNYNVKSIAFTTDHLIYGNNVEFISKGSKWNPWKLYDEISIEDYEFISTVNNEYAYLITSYNNFYRYDPVNKIFVGLTSVPIDLNGTSYYAMAGFSAGNFIYQVSNKDNNLLKFDITGNIWYKTGAIPFAPGSYTYGCVLNDIGYFMKYENFYAYNVSGNSWLKLSSIPYAYNVSVLVADGYIYAFSNNQQIWKYDPLLNSWKEETVFPGRWYGNIIGIAIKNKLYYGLSYDYYDSNTPASKEFWEYSIDTKTWKKLMHFPLSHSKRGIVNFTINGKGYFGFYFPTETLYLYQFDPQKIKS